MPRQWRFIDSGYGDAYSNMAMDEALLLSAIEGHGRPTLRFYGWHPAAVSIGYAQDVNGAVNLAACKKRGLPLIRRPTGGRGVLHQKELTYALVAPQDFFPDGGVLPTYRIIAEGLVQGLRRLGVAGCLTTPRTRTSPGTRGQNGAAACFLASSWYEITVEGRKLIGSAQRRLKGYILQHGSILRAADYEAILELFPAPNAGSSIKLKERIRNKITSLGELLDRELPLEYLKQQLREGFAQALAVEFVADEPTAYERQLARRLYEQKYSTPLWNFKRGGIR